jgi:hypothetical protein
MLQAVEETLFKTQIYSEGMVSISSDGIISFKSKE